MSEAVILTVSVVAIAGLKILSKKLVYKYKKNSLKKNLELSLDFIDENLVDTNVLVQAALKMKEFDAKNSTRKMEKIVNSFLEKNPELNRKNLLEMCESGDFSDFGSIWDQTQEEIEKDEDFVDAKLDEITMRRNEILRRKQKVKTRALAKEKAKGRKNTSSAMG